MIRGVFAALVAAVLFFGLGLGLNVLAQGPKTEPVPTFLEVTPEPAPPNDGLTYPPGKDDAEMPCYSFWAEGSDVEVGEIKIRLNGDIQYFEDLKFWMDGTVLAGPFDILGSEMTFEISFSVPLHTTRELQPTVDISGKAQNGAVLGIDIIGVTAFFRGTSRTLPVPVNGLPAIGHPITVKVPIIVMIGGSVVSSPIPIGQTVNLFNLGFEVQGGTVYIKRIVLNLDGTDPEKDLQFVSVEIDGAGVGKSPTVGEMSFDFFPPIARENGQNFQVSVLTFAQTGPGHWFSISLTRIEADDDNGNLVQVVGLPFIAQWQIAGEPEPTSPTIALSVNGEKFSPGDAIPGVISLTAGSEEFSGEVELWRKDPPTPNFPNGRWVIVGKWSVSLIPGIEAALIYQTIAPNKIKPGTYQYAFVAVLSDKEGNEVATDAESWDLVVPEKDLLPFNLR